MRAPRGPALAADVLIELDGGRVVLIRRKNPPPGWAIPGGFVDVGETVEAAAVREAREETGLEVELTDLFGVYSDPARDPRQHTVSVIYIGRANGIPRAGDDAAEAAPFTESGLPAPLAFDHERILAEYFAYRRSGERPPVQPPLSAREGAALLAIARQAIALRLGAETAAPPPSMPALDRKAGIFVTLRDGETLRGCIGSLSPERTLASGVAESAVAAAFDDPRFPPLTMSELTRVIIEISVLSRARSARAEDVVAGVHGVALARGEKRALFLPQVATELGWSAVELLEETCAKADLPREAWRDPETTISIFTAQTFEERVPS